MISLSVVCAFLVLALGCLLIGFLLSSGMVRKIFRAATIFLAVASFIGLLIFLAGMHMDQCIDKENRLIVAMVVLAVILFSASIVVVTRRTDLCKQGWLYQLQLKVSRYTLSNRS